MCTFALPTRLVSDHGSALTSRTFKIFCETYAIRHVLNAVVTPRSSRQCERYNKAIVTRSLGHSCKKITECVNKCINSTPVKSVLDYQCPSC
jgi:hypothetical protein